MKKLILMGMLMVPILSFAADDGKEVGNGGGGVVCRDSEGKIISAQMLDLFEADDYQLTIIHSNKTADVQFDDIVKRLAKNKDGATAIVARGMKMAELLFKRDFTFISEGRKLEPTKDVVPVISKKGCAIEQVANYLQNGDLKVDSEIYRAFSETEKAALKVHETIYKSLRQDKNIPDTRAIRKLVAFLFSTDATDNEIYGLVIDLLYGKNYPGAKKYSAAAYVEKLDFELAGGSIHCKSKKSSLEVLIEMKKNRTSGVFPEVNNLGVKEENRAFWGDFDLEVSLDQARGDIMIMEEEGARHTLKIDVNDLYNNTSGIYAEVISEWDDSRDVEKFTCSRFSLKL